MAHWLENAVAQGYVGVAIDETPNENYTVAGVTAGADTPETLDPADPDPNQFHAPGYGGRPIGPTAGGGGTPEPEPEE